MRSQERLLDAITRQQDKGDFEKAVRVCNQLIESHPTCAQGYFERGVSYFRLQQPDKALADFETTWRLDSTYFHLRYWLARALDAVGRHAEAGETTLAELRENPDYFPGMGVLPAAWAEGARYFCNAGLPERAISMLKEYFRDHAANVTETYADSSTDPLRLYAALMLAKGDLPEARKAVELARVNPFCTRADGLMWVRILAASGDLDGALAEFDTVFPEGAYWEEAARVRDELLARKSATSSQ
jgi:tetratricopeptide (TPR) repeat protein